MFHTYKNIWFCGLAASGKTTVLRYLKQQFPEADFFNDSLEIVNFINNDAAQQHHKKPTQDSFVLTDSAATHHAVNSIIKKVSNSENNTIIELSRGKDLENAVDFSYKYLFKNLPENLKKNSLFVYIHSDVAERSKRNAQRPPLSKNATVLESFFCPQEAFNRFFLSDDFLEAVKSDPVNHLYIPNIYDLDYFQNIISNLFTNDVKQKSKK